MEFQSCGIFNLYNDYLIKKQYATGRWSFVDKELLLYDTLYTVAFIDSCTIELENGDSRKYLYRLGHEPGGYIFDKKPHQLSLGIYNGEFTTIEPQLFSVCVREGSSYMISWEDSWQSDSDACFNGAIEISAYKADKKHAYFTSIDSRKKRPQFVVARGNSIYFIIHPLFLLNAYTGTYALTITEKESAQV